MSTLASLGEAGATGQALTAPRHVLGEGGTAAPGHFRRLLHFVFAGGALRVRFRMDFAEAQRFSGASGPEGSVSGLFQASERLRLTEICGKYVEIAWFSPGFRPLSTGLSHDVAMAAVWLKRRKQLAQLLDPLSFPEKEEKERKQLKEGSEIHAIRREVFVRSLTVDDSDLEFLPRGSEKEVVEKEESNEQQSPRAGGGSFGLVE